MNYNWLTNKQTALGRWWVSGVLRKKNAENIILVSGIQFLERKRFLLFEKRSLQL